MGKRRAEKPVDPDALARAAAEDCLVRVKRNHGDSIDGFIVRVTPRWTALAVLADTIDLDGYALIRTPLARRLKHLERRTQFVRQVLQARDQWPPEPLGPFDGTNDETLILAHSASFPLMSVYTEGERPDVCYIGRPRDVTTEAIAMDEGDTCGEWLEPPSRYRHAKVTRIGGGGRYEAALQIAASVSPPRP